jgi:Icc protein
MYSAWWQVIGGSQKLIQPQSLVTNAHEARKILKPYNVKLVLSGHGHIRERIETDHQVHIQSGAVCGNWWRGKLNGDAECFAVVSCTPTEFSYRYEEFGWTARKTS